MILFFCLYLLSFLKTNNFIFLCFVFLRRLYYLGCARIASDVGLYSYSELCEMAGKVDTMTPAKGQKIKEQNKWSVKPTAESVPFYFDD